MVREITHPTARYIRTLHGTLFAWKTLRGMPVIWAVVLAITAAKCAVTYLPPLQGLLGTVAVPARDRAMIVGIGVVFLLVLEAEKQIQLRLTTRRAEESP
jgi:hypothetical protein